ncbi:Hypothetical_protein [Hexamita inflata]|uniref:Hypothetical_protein n=1 Tax=Hexamita inflata TaxID=28002 RepID=A0AA86R8E2_9EUKA|nr:Hypothetical protein HINF_LOCUS60936 [Hexamita inflata]CAI9973294.1 Hypothetical protein HINF_LOCUS60939 [Hexamita inflata]
MRNVQSSITGINGQISNINYINQIQNNDILTLRSQIRTSSWNGAVQCKVFKANNFVSELTTGFCSYLSRCCRPNNGQYECYKGMALQPTMYSAYLCGEFIPIQ